jgi:LysM repeat protein
MRKGAFFVLFLLFMTNGCSTTRPARMGFLHTISGGETLWSIARNYGVDFREVVRVNGLRDPNAIKKGDSLWIPTPDAPYPQWILEPASLVQVARLVGPQHAYSDWRTITLHHSATENGSASSFSRYHSRRQMGGLFYHFVIGNGHGAPDGSIEAGWRWREQVEVKRPHDIQICLVGDFTQQEVSDAELRSLAQLVTVLREQYGIPLSGVRRHRDIPGLTTQCPGNRFPFQKLLSVLAQTSSAP